MPFYSRIHPGPRNDGDEEVEVEERGREEKKWWARRAGNLVKGHIRSKRAHSDVSRAKSNRWASLKRLRNLGDTPLDEGEPSNHNRDLESHAAEDNNISHIPPLPQGQGVLSTLLALYNAGGGVSGSSSVATSRSGTPYGSDSESHVHPEEDQHAIERDLPTSYFDPRAPTTSTVTPFPKMSTSPPLGTALPHKQKARFSVSLPSASRTASSLHLPTFDTLGTRVGRPKAATNAGGVFGSLIATSGNLTGPAAPAPSTIGPNVKRKGFGLSRLVNTRYIRTFSVIDIWHLVDFRYEIELDNMESDPQTVDPRRIRSAPATPQLKPNVDFAEDSTPASETAGTGTPESTTDTLTSQRNGKSTRKRKQGSLATLTEWLPPSFHSRPSTPMEKSAIGDDDASGHFEMQREHGKAYRRAKREHRRKAEIFVSCSSHQTPLQHLARFHPFFRCLIFLSHALLLRQITKHVAELMQRQEFLLKLARALMM